MSEEIAGLARSYLEDPHGGGLSEIDRTIEEASAEARWDDVGKWHRVRLRFLRFRQERHASAQLVGPRDSPAQG